MNFIYIGDLVNTHGIKGEVRIVSDFKYKDQIFKPGFKLYIGKKKEMLIIKTHRVHKNYDMVTLEGINSIEDAIIYKGELVYINRNDLKEYDYLSEDLINMEVYDENNEKLGIVKTIDKNIIYEILIVNNGKKDYFVPNIPEFVLKVDLDKKRIIIKNIKGLIDEN